MSDIQLEYLVNGEQIIIPAIDREEYEKYLSDSEDEWEFIGEVSVAPKEQKTEAETVVDEFVNPDFQTSPVVSADAGQEIVAQDNMELPSEDGSLELQKVTEDVVPILGVKEIEDIIENDDRVTAMDTFKSFNEDPNIKVEDKTVYLNESKSKQARGVEMTYTNPSTGESESIQIKGVNSATSEEISKFINNNVSEEFITGSLSQFKEIKEKIGSVSEEEVNSKLKPREEIFKGYSEIQNVSGVFDEQGNKIGGGTTRKEVLINPYENEIKELEQNILDNSNGKLTAEEINKKAKDRLYADLRVAARNDILDSKTQNYLYDNEEKRAAFNLGSTIKNKEVARQFENNLAVSEADLFQISNLSTSFATLQDYIDGTPNLGLGEFVANGKSIRLGDLSDGSEVLIFKGGAKVTKKQVEFIEQAQASMNALGENYIKTNNTLTSQANELGDLSIQMNAAGLNYSIAEKSAITAYNGLASIGVGAGMAVAKGANWVNYGIREVGGLVSRDVQISNKKFFDENNEWLNEKGVKWKKYQDDIRGAMVRDVSLKEGFNGEDGNFGRFVMQEISSQAPILIAMAASGGTLAPWTIGAYTAGDKMMDIAYEDSLTGTKTGEFEMLMKGIGVGIANGAFTALTTNPILQRGIGAFKSNKFGNEFLLGTRDYVKNTWKRALIYDNALELSGELATNVVENAIDGRNIFENADHVAVSSLGFSFTFSGLPFFKGIAVRQYGSSFSINKLDKRQRKIFELNRAWEQQDPKSASAKLLGRQLEELKKEQQSEIESIAKKASEGIDKIGSRYFLKASERVNTAQQDASDIVNNKNLSYKQKQESLSELEKEFNTFKTQRDLYLDKGAFGDNFVLLKAINSSEYNDYIEKARQELNSDDVTSKVEEKASDLYRAQIIRDKFNKNHKGKGSAKLFETKEEAITEIEKLGESGKADPVNVADAVENIKADGSGVNLKLLNGKSTAIAVVESQVKNAKEGVIEHEISHGVMDMLFDENKDAMIQMSDQVSLWLSKANPALHQKIKLNLSEYTRENSTNKESYKGQFEEVIAEEYLANFFELVAENRIDLSSQENSSFAGLAGYMMENVAGNNYDFDFKGPKDFARFAISIGNGIKNGTVDIGSLRAIKAQSDKISPDTKTKPVSPKGKVSKSMSLQEKYDEADESLFQATEEYNLDPNDPTAEKNLELAEKAFDLAEAALEKGVEPEGVTDKDKKEYIPIEREKKDNAKKKRSLTPEEKAPIENDLAEAQKQNKELLAKEKARFDKRIKEINDAPESEISRTKKLSLLKLAKENPQEFKRTQNLIEKKSSELTALETKINEALKVPFGKFITRFSQLYYNRIPANAKKILSVEEWKQSLRTDLLTMTIKEYKKNVINRAGEKVTNDIEDIIFQRGQLRIRDLANRLGVLSKEKGIAKGEEALGNVGISDNDFELKGEQSSPSQEKSFKTEKRRPSALLASQELYNKAAEGIEKFWEDNKGNSKIQSFRGLPILIDNILAEMYGVNPGTFSNPKGALNNKNYPNVLAKIAEKQVVFRVEEGGVMREVRSSLDGRTAKEASDEITAQLNEEKKNYKGEGEYTFEEYSPESMLEGIIRLLPEIVVPKYMYDSANKGREINKRTGVPENIVDLAYDVKDRGTLGQGNRTAEVKSVSFQDALAAIGGRIDENGDAVVDLDMVNETGKAPSKTKMAQTLLGLIRLQGRTITNEIVRSEIKDLEASTRMDIAMGKRANMYSKPFNPEIFNPKNFNTKAISEEQIGDIYNLLKNEFDRTKGKMSGVNAANFILEHTSTLYGRQPGAIYRNQWLELYEKFDPEGYSESEAQIKMIKDLQYSFGQAFKYVVQEKAINKEWNKIERLKDRGVSKETKIKTIKDYVNRWNRAGRDIDYNSNFNFLGATNNSNVFKAIEKASGLTTKNLNDLGFTLVENGFGKTINLDGKPLGLMSNTDSIKKNLNSQSVTDNNVGAATINKDSKVARKEMYDIIDPFIKDSDIEGAKAALALMNLSQNGIARKLAVMGRIFKMNIDDKTILDHNPSMSYVNLKIAEYIDDKINKDSLNAYLDKTTVNNISKDIDTALNKEGGLEAKRYDPLDKLEKKAAININYFAKNQKTANSNSKSLPINLQVDGLTIEESLKQAENFDKAIQLGNSLDQPTKGISVWDFDDTLATTKSNVLFTMPDGTKGKLDASRFAKEGDEMLANGAKFDFSEFSKVVEGEKGPFFEKAMARNKKFGNENVYVLTARPANSAFAIHEFLKGIGLDIPLSNITGLANSNPQAKANWVVNKFAEGYNDFYFADDHIGNVKAVKEVLETLDVKSKVQQARVKSSKALDKRFNEIIEQESGIESYKNYETVKAGLKGRAKKFRMRFFIPPSAEDFLGLLYTTLPKGKQGDSALEFYKEHLLQPYAKAINGLRKGRIAMGKDYRAIKEEFGIVPRKLKKTFKYEDKNGDIKESLFSKEMAVRVHSWNSQGIEIPGLSKVDLPILVSYVNANPDLKAFSDKLVELKKGQEPAKLTDGWEAGTITSDLLNDLNTEGRKKLLEVWQQNVDVIFSQKNLNKLEAAYGKSYVKSLKDSLRRMKSGRNTTPSPNTVTDNFVMWLNGAIGNIMFLNRRSAVLQMLSFTNFINFEGNNIYQASRAFANQPQYWKDWIYLMNSDYLVDRRDGLRINVNEADIATTAKEGGFQGVLAKVLQGGFLPTKMADSAAIATGGASFYRNKVNALVKDGMNLVAAEKQAMEDFIATAETSQQSSDPSKISKQQSEPIGRIILAFANTPSQYARIMKRSAQDLKNGRGNASTHISRIVYYGVLQNLMFNFLQQAMFAAMGFGDDDATEEESEEQEATRNKKMINVANSMLDGILRGIGVGGAIFSVLKNLGIKLYRQSEKTRNKNYAKTITNELLKLSPPLSSKLSKLSRAGDAIEWGQKEIKHDKLSLKHPYVTAGSLTIAGVTSLPTDRVVGMAIDAVDIASANTEAWMKPLIVMGWPKWQLESEKTTAANRKAKKDRLKAAEEKEEWDSLSEEEKGTKVLMDLKKDEQVKILISLGVSKKLIREKLKKEEDRVQAIKELRDMKNKENKKDSLRNKKDSLK
jgi:hypothetical protein